MQQPTQQWRKPTTPTHRTKRFGEIITGIENPRKMLHDKNFLLTPFLDGKMLDVDVWSTESGTFLIDHMESCHI